MRKMLKNKKGITLIALIITIILMLILAGVVLNLTIGENGLINWSKYAAKKWNNAVEQEQRDLDELYGSILIAGDSKVTLDMQKLDEYISSKLQPTGIKTDSYICNSSEENSAYSEKTSMDGFARTADENNCIGRYLSYSDELGYSVLKSGWYFVRLESGVCCSSQGGVGISINVNGVCVTEVYSLSLSGAWDTDRDAFSLYLREGDKVYFGASTTGNNAAHRMVKRILLSNVLVEYEKEI